MRLAFILFRLLGYAAVLATIVSIRLSPLAWFWILVTFMWSIYDHLKRPDDSFSRLRLGVWLEAVLILISALWLHQPVFFFLLMSPVARTCVHLSNWDSLSIGATSMFVIWAGDIIDHAPTWVIWSQMGSLIAAGSYSLVMGILLKQQDRLRKALTVSVFEQEQRARDEERLRIATQLHDVMGQNWTAVIRALDVAAATDGDIRASFLTKARTAALDGLDEMRKAVKAWNHERQTSDEWMQFLQQSVTRLRELTGVTIQFVSDRLDWHRLSKPELTAEAIARIAVESITNAIRHGQARTMQVDISSSHGVITLTVKDDGIGLQATGSVNPGTGICSMRHLAASIDGAFMLDGNGPGTVVELTIQYQAESCEEVIV